MNLLSTSNQKGAPRLMAYTVSSRPRSFMAHPQGSTGQTRGSFRSQPIGKPSFRRSCRFFSSLWAGSPTASPECPSGQPRDCDLPNCHAVGRTDTVLGSPRSAAAGPTVPLQGKAATMGQPIRVEALLRERGERSTGASLESCRKHFVDSFPRAGEA
jgi:hypothetical protein